MAITQLSDVQFDPDVYATYLDEQSVVSTAFMEAGIVEQNPLLDERANGPSDITSIPNWNPLDGDTEPNYSDDTENKATPQKIGTGKQVARNAYINEAWKSADLVKELNAAEPMRAIAAKTVQYWREQFQHRVIKSLVGILADNDANDGDDMLNNIAIADGNNAASANLISRTAFTKTVFTNGDRYDSFGAIAMHSVVYNRLVNNEDIDFIPDSQGRLVIPTFLGLRVIVSDKMPVVAGGTSGFIYTSILFGGACIGFGEGMPKNPVAYEREELEGNGGGTETLVERKTWLIHPYGFKWNEASVAGTTPTWAELQAAANWDRVFNRKNIPLAFLKSNG